LLIVGKLNETNHQTTKDDRYVYHALYTMKNQLSINLVYNGVITQVYKDSLTLTYPSRILILHLKYMWVIYVGKFFDTIIDVEY
jgi:hypothetical protein